MNDFFLFKKELNKWRDSSCSQIGRLSIVKMSVLPKLVCRVNALPIKNFSKFVCGGGDINKTILKRGTRPRRSNAVLKEKNVRGLTLPNFKIYSKLQ